MPNYAKTASATAKVRQTGSDLRNPKDIAGYINTYYDSLVDEKMGEIQNMYLMSLFSQMDQKKDTDVIKTKVQSNAVAGLNYDGDALPFLSWGEGWSYERNVYPFAMGVKHSLHLEEIDEIGSVRQEAKELMDAGKRTIAYAVADVFNRAIAPATGAQFLCPDGMFLIDSARPNPVIGVPAWSNEEATGAITEDLLFTAQLNAANMVAHNGDQINDVEIAEALIPLAYEKVAWKLNSTSGTVGNANNDANWGQGRFKYRTVREFTVNQVIYLLSDVSKADKPLQFLWGRRMQTMPINFEDPRIIGQLLRFRFGIACMDPRRFVRGGLLTAL